MDENKMMQLLDWTYDKAINGLPGVDSAEDLASNYFEKLGDIEKAIKTLIRWQKVKCTASGFVSGLPGLPAMPVTISANISNVLYINLRMIAAIAHLRGYDIRDDRVRTLAYVCLCGNAGKDILKVAGIKIGTKLTKNAVNKIAGTTLIKITCLSI